MLAEANSSLRVPLASPIYETSSLPKAVSIDNSHTDIVQNAASLPIPVIAPSPIPDCPTEEEKKAFEVTKAWYLRRLQDRWRCKTNGHSYCFVNKESGPHIKLTDKNMKHWVDTIVRLHLPFCFRLLDINDPKSTTDMPQC